jgi:activator of HSP90 ATPase
MAFTGISTRRQAIIGAVSALGALVAGSAVPVLAAGAMGELPSTASDRLRTSLHQEIDLHASVHRIYEMLLDSQQFAAFTGMPATIDPYAGGAFSMFGGLIVGRNIELVADTRIVQAWRPADWTAGAYSVVRFELNSLTSGTKVVLDHTGFPEGDYDHLYAGWGLRYWRPLERFLAKHG